MTVTVFSTPSCIQCLMTKKELAKNEIDFESVDLSKDEKAKEYVTGLGYTSAPVVVVKDEAGEQHWSGFRVDRIRGLAG